ncbi:DUF2523 domain-containing protein [Photobacterium sp. CCB-ST2H9]|uniref:DUF2523 family protein n=1 Tax=Photobacterium sp. CCB-ST2H9 TaxID=2912855 RepID=UPI0020052FA0|nr:DUF2523 family protein [Photobacterium sp. CCB-ST2H9]UTM60125.1 DUF2523 domain-containing protein [Photobacterium sp. CCB-ST2H9]
MYDWIVELFNILLNFLYNLVVSLVNMLKDLMYFLFEQVLELSKGLVAMISKLLTPIDLSQYFTSLPDSVAWVFGQVGLPQAVVMIITAITIRLILQLIPFTRLGS